MYTKIFLSILFTLTTLHSSPVENIDFPTMSPSMLEELSIKKQKHEELQQDFQQSMNLLEKQAKIVDNEMKKILLSKKDDEKIKLLIALPRFSEYQSLYDELQNSMGAYSYSSKGNIYTMNTKELTPKQIIDFNAQKDRAIQGYLSKQAKKRESISQDILRYLQDNNLSSSLDNKKKSYSHFTAEMTKKELKDFLKNNSDNIRAVGLDAEHELSIAGAMIATRVDPVVLHWTPQRNNQRGGGIGIYFADAQCNDAGDVAGLYHEFPGTAGHSGFNWHTFLVGGIIASVAPDAYKYCKNSSNTSGTITFPNNFTGALPTNNEIFNNIGPRIRVESYSLNRNSANSNVYTTEDSIFDEHVRDTGNMVFISTGNLGSGASFVVESPAKGYNIISVGNYDDATDALHNTSNYINSTLGNEKPELIAPGANITYTFNTRNESGTGTSFSAPHTAGIAADFMSENPWLNANAMVIKAMMLASATDEIGDVANAQTTGDSAIGAGGINAETAIYHDRAAAYWNDPNGSGPFDWASNHSCYTDWTFSAPSSHSRTRVALTWMIDENYVLQNADHGTILYFNIKDADNHTVANSWQGSTEYPNSNNWEEDNWAVAEFNPNHANDRYTMSICRYNSLSNNKNATINMAYAVTSGF